MQSLPRLMSCSIVAEVCLTSDVSSETVPAVSGWLIKIVNYVVLI